MTSPNPSSFPFVGAIFQKDGSNCQPLMDAGVATSGSITFSSLNASGASGTFSLWFGTDQLTGDFNVSNCDIPLDGGLTYDGGTLTCR
jgi:hypothetical protein